MRPSFNNVSLIRIVVNKERPFLLGKGWVTTLVGVTGVNGGIGAALVQVLEDHGVTVAGFARNPLEGQYRLDVTWESGNIDFAMRTALGGEGQYDAWINLAGADILSKGVRSLSYMTRLDMLWRTDVEGTVKCSRAVVPYLRPGGLIVNMAWDEAVTGAKGESAELYGTAKSAVLGFSASLARSLAPHRRVCVVSPGWVQTRWGNSLSLEQRERLVKGSAGRQWISARTVANVVYDLLHSPGQTGQVITVR